MAKQSGFLRCLHFVMATLLVSTSAMVAVPSTAVQADSQVTSTIPLGGGGYNPWGVAVNPDTNRIYTANDSSHNISILDGSNNTLVGKIDVGTNPAGIGINSNTNRLYVANNNGESVSVIDGSTNSIIAEITVGVHPLDVAVNPVSNQVYVLNNGSNTVSQISGSANIVVGSITVGNEPVSLAINNGINRLYVANYSDNSVSVINSNSNAVVANIPVGENPVEVEINSTTNRVYVANSGSASITVIDGSTNAVLTTIDNVAVSSRGLAINQVTNRIYAANDSSNSMAVIDGSTNTTIASVPIPVSSHGLAVNNNTNRVYMTNYDSNSVSVVNGATNAITATISTGVEPAGIAVNPVTSRLYVAKYDSNAVSVINTTNNSLTAAVNVGMQPLEVAVNTLTNRVYVSNSGSNTLSVINGAANTLVTNIDVGHRPTGLAVSESLNRIYVANYGSNTISVINGVDNTVMATINVGMGPKYIARVSGPPELMYVTNYGSNTISMIDTATNSVIYTVDNTGTGTSGLAVNNATHRLFVTNEISNTVSVLDSTTNNVIATVNVGNHPQGIAVNPIINRIYVANLNDNTISVISGANNNVVATVTVGDWPEGVALNASLNYIYVTNRRSDSVSVIQDSTSSTTNVVSSANPSDQGQPVTFTAKVSGNGGTPSGTVTFRDGAATLGSGTLNVSGEANYTASALVKGSHEISAVYSGDAYFAASTASLTQVVVHIVFPDVNLEAVIRQAINKPTGDIYQSDLLNLINLNAENNGISDLSGLEYCSNLQELNLYKNDISDISTLSSLLNLRILQINNNQVNNLSALANLFNLSEIDLNSNQINNISVLSGLPSLVSLDLGDNRVSNITPLANLNLQHLYLANNQIGNLAILTSLPGLLDLDLSNNRISNISVLANLANLHTLNLGNNQISDITVLGNLGGLQSLVLDHNSISDISALAANSGLWAGDYLNLAYNVLSVNTSSQNMSDIQTLLNRGVALVYEPQFTVTTLTSSQNPAIYGQLVAFTATINPVPDSGTVQFILNGANQGAPASINESGEALFETSIIPSGTYSITAVYSGNTSFVSSTAQVLTQIVEKAPAVVIWPNPADIVYGTALSDTQLQATAQIPGTFVYSPAAGNVPGAGVRTLNVTFTPDESANYTTGTASVNLNVTKAVLQVTADDKNMVYSQPLPVLTAGYSGFVNGDTLAVLGGSPNLITEANINSPVGMYAITLSPGTLNAANYDFMFADGSMTITQAGTTATLSASSNPANIGYPVTFTFRVRAISPATGMPQGIVIFSEGSTELASVSLIEFGIATFTTSDLPEGSHSISARYDSNSNFSSSAASIIENMVTSVGLILHGSDSAGSIMESAAPIFNSTGLGAMIGAIVSNVTNDGINDLVNGTNGGCNIAMVSRSLTPAETTTLTAYPIARDANIMIVSQNVPNDVIQLTVEQIKGIYEGAYTNWNQVGSATDMQIVVRAGNLESDNRQTMLEQCGINDADEHSFISGTGLERIAGDSGMREAISEAIDGAIGYVNLGFGADPLFPNIREIRVVNSSDMNAYAADTRSIYSGRYPLVNCLSLVTLGPADSNQMLLIDWMRQIDGLGQDNALTAGFLKLIPNQDVGGGPGGATDYTVDVSDLVAVGNQVGEINPGNPHWIRADVAGGVGGLPDGAVDVSDLVEVGNWAGISIVVY